MAVSTGTLAIRGRVYNMTGVSGFTPSGGTDLGKVSDLLLAELERDIQVYTGLEYGSTPKYASIDGSGVIFEFGLSEYSAAVITLISQRIQPATSTINYHGALAGSYVLGRTLGSSELLKLLIADEDNPTTRPMLLIPKAVIVKVGNLSFSMAERHTDPATIQIIGLHDSTLGAPFAYGDPAKFTEA